MTRPSLKASRAGIGPGKETRGAMPSLPREFAQLRAVGAGADQHRARNEPARATDAGDRFEQRVDALGGAQFADIEQIGGVGVGRRRREFGRPDAVGDDVAHAAPRADEFVEAAGDIGALEQEDVGQRRQSALGQHVGAMLAPSRGDS